MFACSIGSVTQSPRPCQAGGDAAQDAFCVRSARGLTQFLEAHRCSRNSEDKGLGNHMKRWDHRTLGQDRDLMIPLKVDGPFGRVPSRQDPQV